MPVKFASALRSSLQRLAPPEAGIAYLLYRVGSHYWIPIATSSPELDSTPYYRLGYAFELGNSTGKTKKIGVNDIGELVSRGKLESLVFNSPFFQMVSAVGNGDVGSLAIVRSSTKEIVPQLSKDAEGFYPLMELIHELWGDRAFNSLTTSGENLATPALIAQKATEFLSDKFPFPPYFLFTDYVLSVYAEGSRERHVCTNPLGYSHWMLKKFAEDALPWIEVMSERTSSYSEDLCEPRDISIEQVGKYKKALGSDLMANHLAKTLRDDAALVSVVNNQDADGIIKLWARHNKPKGAAQSDVVAPRCCSHAIEGLRFLLNEPHQDDDFLVTLWATSFDPIRKSWKVVHVGADTSYRLPSVLDEKDEAEDGWRILSYPPNCDSSTPYRVGIKFRSSTDTPIDLKNIEKVLAYSHQQLGKLDRKAAIRSFWSGVTVSAKTYRDTIFKTCDPRHEMKWWKDNPVSLEQELFPQIVLDFASIAHFTDWNGIKTYATNFKDVYVHLARGFRDLNIAAELVEFMFGMPSPIQRDQLEFITCDNEQKANLLIAFSLLRSNGWKIKSAGGSEHRKFILELELETNNGTALEVAKSCLEDESQLGDRSELRSACTWLRKCATSFSVLVAGSDTNRVGLRCEFNGGKKACEKTKLSILSPN